MTGVDASRENTDMDTSALLEAGAILPVGAAVTKHDTADILTARTYHHSGLSDRTVVRLVPQTLGQAEDLAMEFLLFDHPERVDPVGLVRQQALGFPAWALVNDPANGHHALALVKEIERLARVARSRVGPAKDGFTALGDRLARAVPHFLPTFYEEAGRVFLTADSPTYAATMFGRAREAEQTYALAVDEERQHAVFLEFALAGALTAKAMSAHARQLAGRCETEAAYERFTRLCVERTLGGMPPYRGMHTDLRRLAKAAGVSHAAADERILREVITAPVLAKAPEAFWTAYRASLVQLASVDPSIRGALLAIIPINCQGDTWLALLAECDAQTALTCPAGTAQPNTESPDGPAGWLTRFAAHHCRGWGKVHRSNALLTLVKQMAPRLIADGVPVSLWGRYNSIDLDLIDLCLTLGIPVAELPNYLRMNLSGWLAEATPGRRDLLAIAADTRFQPTLTKQTEDVLQSSRNQGQVPQETLQSVLAVPGLKRILHDWLTQLADQIVRCSLPDLKEQLDRAALLCSPRGVAVNPEAMRRIAEHNLGPILGRTLRSGVFSEFTWPALEEAQRRIAEIKGKDETTTITRQWPYLLISRGTLVLVLGPDGIVAEHVTRIPADQRRWSWRNFLRFTEGQLMVSWYSGDDQVAYWSGAPDDVFTVTDKAFARPYWNDSIALPDGSRTSGGRPLRVGDHSEQVRGSAISDGVTYWAYTNDTNEWQWHEYDPATGALGRACLPTFFEQGAVDGQPLELGYCYLYPLPSSEPTAGPRPEGKPATTSPLGSVDGLVGWRVRRTPDKGYSGESINGQAFTLPGTLEVPGSLMGVVRFPGSDLNLGIAHSSSYNNEGVSLCAPDGFVASRYTINTEVPPPQFWHYLRPRDEVGSHALRTLTDEQAAALLTCLAYDKDDQADQTEVRIGATTMENKAMVALVQRIIPQISEPALVEGVAQVVRTAAKRAAQLRVLAGVLADSANRAASGEIDGDTPAALGESIPVVRDGQPLHDATAGLMPSRYGQGENILAFIAAIGEAMTSPTLPQGRVHRLAASNQDWLHTVGVLPALLVRAASPLFPADQRAALLTLLESVVAEGLCRPGSRLRLIKLMGTPPPDKATSSQATSSQATSAGQVTSAQPGAGNTVAGQFNVAWKFGDLVQVGDNRLLLRSAVNSDGECFATQYAPEGTFTPIPGCRITSEELIECSHLSPEQVTAFVERIRERGVYPVVSDRAVELSTSAGMSLAEATLLLAALPGDEAWEHPDTAEARAAMPNTKPALTTARRTWTVVDWRIRSALLAAMLPDEITDLLDHGPRPERVAALWARERGSRTPVSDDLIVEVDRMGICGRASVSELLHGLANPETCRWLSGPAPWIGNNSLLSPWTEEDSQLAALSSLVPWLAYALPAGSPLRATLPTVVKRVRQRLADPDLGLFCGYLTEKELHELVSALGITPMNAANSMNTAHASNDTNNTDIGPIKVEPGNNWRKARLYPARLTGPDDPAITALLAHLEYGGRGTIEIVREWLSDQIATMVSEPVPDIGENYLHNPHLAAPNVVAEVEERTGLSSDAAALYLQLLALPDPTDRNVARWTGWKPARLKTARAELAGSNLVVVAKRARAGRSQFLPGGWLALKTGPLPLERWKLPLLLGGEQDIIRRRIALPVAQPPRLFALAWERILRGDEPRFDELVTERRR